MPCLFIYPVLHAWVEDMLDELQDTLEQLNVGRAVKTAVS